MFLLGAIILLFVGCCLLVWSLFDADMAAFILGIVAIILGASLLPFQKDAQNVCKCVECHCSK
jgi:hypothetical protein